MKIAFLFLNFPGVTMDLCLASDVMFPCSCRLSFRYGVLQTRYRLSEVRYLWYV